MSDQTPPEAQQTPSPKPQAGFKLLLLVSCAIAVIVVLQNIRKAYRTDAPVSGSSSERTVRLIIEQEGEKPQEFDKIPWQENMTVLDALKLSEIPFVQKGEEELAMVTGIGSSLNEGGGLEAKNWMYWVNDALAKDSFAVHRLKPADTILWKFSASQYNETAQ